MAAVERIGTAEERPRVRVRTSARSRPRLRLVPGAAALLHPKAAEALILAARPLFPK